LILFTSAQAFAAFFSLSPGAALPLAAGVVAAALADGEVAAFIAAALADWLFEAAAAGAAGAAALAAGLPGSATGGLGGSPAVAVVATDTPAPNDAAMIA
jgi:hypothetical protein